MIQPLPTSLALFVPFFKKLFCFCHGDLLSVSRCAISCMESEPSHDLPFLTWLPFLSSHPNSSTRRNETRLSGLSLSVTFSRRASLISPSSWWVKASPIHILKHTKLFLHCIHHCWLHLFKVCFFYYTGSSLCSLLRPRTSLDIFHLVCDQNFWKH